MKYLFFLLTLIQFTNSFANWERQQDIYNPQFGYVTENYYNYNNDKTVALVIYRGSTKYEDEDKKWKQVHWLQYPYTTKKKVGVVVVQMDDSMGQLLLTEKQEILNFSSMEVNHMQPSL